MSRDQNNPLRQEKIRKGRELLAKGLNPYPHNWKKERTSSLKLVEIFQKKEGIGQTKPDHRLNSKKVIPLFANFVKTFLQKKRAEALGQTKQFHIAGRLMRKRSMGKAAFFNVQDEEGELQCYIKKEDFHSKDKSQTDSKITSWDIWKLSDIGDILGLSGELFQTKKGEISLRVKDLRMLCKSLETLPEKYHGLEDKELKYRCRHLDLIMSKESREVFKTRSKIIHEIRSFMNEEGFMEVETPVLQPIYGGAAAAPFETHFRRLSNQKMYLKISPEIYLKKLIVGGFEKVFEIGKNFRNEGIDRSHNPEFTMMEYYEAYTDYKDQMKFFEKLVCHVAEKIKGEPHSLEEKEEHLNEAHNAKRERGESCLKFLYQGKELDLTPPWIRISPRQFEDLLYSIGSYSNDGRNNTIKSFIFEYKGKRESPEDFFEIINKKIQEQRETLKNLSKIIDRDMKKQRTNKKNLNFTKFWKEIINDERRQKRESPIQVDNKNKKEKENSNEHQLLKPYKFLLDYTKYIDPDGDFKKFESLLNQQALPSKEQISSYKEELSLTALELTVEKFFWNPVFIMDFPIEMSPLTKEHRDNPKLVERFEPYMAGMEIGNAYTELNDPVEQRKRLEKQERYSEKDIKKSSSLDDFHSAKDNPSKASPNRKEEGRELSQPMDENFLHALEVGMPPTGGVGLGIERLVMILTDQNHIKDSMLFPMLKEK